MDFVAIDVETANADLSSICQIGIASFCDGALTESWSSLVNPQSTFEPMNSKVHGIDADRVKDSPPWDVVVAHVIQRLNNQIAVSHTAFDRIALTRACVRSNVDSINCRWLDSARVVRRAWPQFNKSGYGLEKVAKHFEIEYRAHDALEDARCAGEILLRAIAHTGASAEQWITRMGISGAPIANEGNADGELFGEVLVFTGSLSIARSEAAEAAAKSGCRVVDNVTKLTTLLVVGDQDIALLAGHEKSSKHRKAEQLILEGQRIRILSESDFKRIVS